MFSVYKDSKNTGNERETGNKGAFFKGYEKPVCVPVDIENGNKYIYILIVIYKYGIIGKGGIAMSWYSDGERFDEYDPPWCENCTRGNNYEECERCCARHMEVEDD